MCGAHFARPQLVKHLCEQAFLSRTLQIRHLRGRVGETIGSSELHFATQTPETPCSQKVTEPAKSVTYCVEKPDCDWELVA